jgi:plasmid stability protein
MAQLLVRNIPESLVRALKIRAAEEEHRRILAVAMAETEKSANATKVKNLLDLSIAEEFDDSDDWIFDRNDPRNARPLRKMDMGVFDD